MINHIIFVATAITISVLFYKAGKRDGYIDGTNHGYKHGWIDGDTFARKQRK